MSQKFNPNSQSSQNKEKIDSSLIPDKEQKPYNQEIQQNLHIDTANQKPQQTKQLSQTFSQCPSDADDKIMQNLNKNEQKRYSNLLKSMGMQLKSGQKQKKQTSNPQDERGFKKFQILDSIRKSEINDLDTMNVQVSSVQDRKQIQSNTSNKNSIQYGQVSFDVDNLFQSNHVTNEPMMRSQSMNNQQVRPNQALQSPMRQSQNLSNRRVQNHQQGELQATNYTNRSHLSQVDNGIIRTNSLLSNSVGIGFSQNIQPERSEQTTRYTQSQFNFQRISRIYQPLPEIRLANSIHSQANSIHSQRINQQNDQMNNRRPISATYRQSQQKQSQNNVKIESDQIEKEHKQLNFSQNNVSQNGQIRQQLSQKQLNNSQSHCHIDQNPSFNTLQPKDVQIDGPNFPNRNQIQDVQIDGDNYVNIASNIQNGEIMTSKEDGQLQFATNPIQTSKQVQIDNIPHIIQTKNQSQTSINRQNLSSQNFKQNQSIHTNSQAQKIEVQQNIYNSKQNIHQLSQRLSNHNSAKNQSQKSTHQIRQNQSQRSQNKNSQFHPKLQISQNYQVKITNEQPYNEKMEIQNDHLPTLNYNKDHQEKINTHSNQARPHVNSFSSSFRNSQHYYNSNNQNNQKKQKNVPRKFSQNFNSNNGFSSVLSRQSAQVKHLAQVKSQISSHRKSQRQKNSHIFGNSLANDQQNNLNFNESLQIQQNGPKQNQQVNNCFSNRSQKSNNSNPSNRSSSYRYNRFVDTMQVPQLTSLQIVKSHDGKESRVQRRSSRNSRNSRSASTCRKSYDDDLSQMYMQPIDQKPYEQLDDKSVKKTKTQTRSFNEANYLNHQLQQNLFQQNQNPLQNVFSGTNNIQNCLMSKNSQSLPQQFQKQQNQLEKRSSKINSSQILNNLNDKLQIQSNQNDYIQQNKSEYNQLRKTNSKLMKNPNQQNNKISIEDKKRRLSLTSQPLNYLYSGEKTQIKLKTVQQQVDQIIQKCLQFLDKTHQLSQFQIQQYYLLTSNYFNVRGINLDPINQIGVILLHDGIFVSSYIKFIKKNRNNSAVLESLFYTNFKEQIGITTNQDYFLRNYHKVMQQRRNYQQIQYQNWLKQQEQKRMIIEEKQRQQKKAILQYQAQKAQMIRKEEQLKLKMKKIELQKQEKQKMQALKKQNNKIQQRLKQIQKRQAQLRQKQRKFYQLQDNNSSETATINQKRTEPAGNVMKLIKRTSLLHNVPVAKSQENQQIQDNDNMTASITTRNPFQDFPAVNSKKQQNLPKKRITKKKDRKTTQPSRPIEQLSTQNDQMIETLSKTRSRKIQVQSNGTYEVKNQIKSKQKDFSSKKEQKNLKSHQKQNRSKQKQKPQKSKQKKQGKGILKESKPSNKFVGRMNKEIKNVQPVPSNKASPKQQKRQYSPIQEIQSKSKSSKRSVSQNPNTIKNASPQQQLNDKANSRRVKFTESTKGGSKSHQKTRYRKTGVVNYKEESLNEPKKRLRSRSKSKSKK